MTIGEVPPLGSTLWFINPRLTLVLCHSAFSRIHPSVRSSAPDAGGYLRGSAQVPFGSPRCGGSSHPPLFVA